LFFSCFGYFIVGCWSIWLLVAGGEYINLNSKLIGLLCRWPTVVVVVVDIVGVDVVVVYDAVTSFRL